MSNYNNYPHQDQNGSNLVQDNSLFDHEDLEKEMSDQEFYRLILRYCDSDQITITYLVKLINERGYGVSINELVSILGLSNSTINLKLRKLCGDQELPHSSRNPIVRRCRTGERGSWLHYVLDGFTTEDIEFVMEELGVNQAPYLEFVTNRYGDVNYELEFEEKGNTDKEENRSNINAKIDLTSNAEEIIEDQDDNLVIFKRLINEIRSLKIELLDLKEQFSYVDSRLKHLEEKDSRFSSKKIVSNLDELLSVNYETEDLDT